MGKFATLGAWICKLVKMGCWYTSRKSWNMGWLKHKFEIALKWDYTQVINP